jgi:hypothetical protein
VKSKRLVLVTIIAGLMAACAGPDTVTSAESASEREYPTGSNIPRKNKAPADSQIPMGMGVRVHSREDLERMQQGGAPQNPDAPPRGR